MFTFKRLLVQIPRRQFSTSLVFRAESEAAKEASNLKIKSSCEAGTVLNLKVKKSGAEPVALEDHEYPEWLWEILDPKKQLENLKANPEKYAKKMMRQSNRQKIKHSNFMAKMK
ncbi:54S ribosomal protein L37, mitochondrial [Wickerhamomyces ciferrii]|uniref:Large ribosomal subunit protein mL54 n=1 Tax=Wickerhamomyces ciferrii (strain ATCC 14091 / BCRC 22168 / CBS 111 / JCM 3599 / NBRC 0793 / NRRL Y-1031 F-60-10) TaxID=1206466 RepID=K0KLQ4_WICCF|nr:54S ribosomal protein L37, mitochondrial [Wickerhamomyces ciferrii]CCH42058.1 54S ribosomal protein L37, mitochondrial [Wickerhamomyces ciferrii]